MYFKTKIKLNRNTKVELVQDTFEYDGTPHVPVLKKVTTEDGLDVPISDFEETTCRGIQAILIAVGLPRQVVIFTVAYLLQ